MGPIYLPSDDSLFFAKLLEDYLSNLKDKEISYLDIGTGSSILAETAKHSGVKDITTTDINSKAVALSRKKGFYSIKSDLFSSPILKDKKFDLITFNAPYLPEDKSEPEDSKLATTGGKRGDEISLKFLKQAVKHLKKEGKIFLLISSLTPKNQINKCNPKIVAKKKLFMEELILLQFQ